MNTTSDVSRVAKFLRNLSIILLLVIPVAPLGAKFGLLSAFAAMGAFALSALLCLIIELIIVFWLMRKPSAGTKSLLRQAGIYAFPAVLISGAAMQNMMSGGGGQSVETTDGRPAMIHNISTDIDNPPQFEAAIEQRGDNSNPLEYTAEIATIQKQKYPDLSGLETSLSKAEAFNKALKTAQDMGWAIYAQSPEAGIIEGVATTRFFSFKDDVVIRITETSTGSKIDLRSVSRVGGGDMDANANRIKAFMANFAAK